MYIHRIHAGSFLIEHAQNICRWNRTSKNDYSFSCWAFPKGICVLITVLYHFQSLSCFFDHAKFCGSIKMAGSSGKLKTFIMNWNNFPNTIPEMFLHMKNNYKSLYRNLITTLNNTRPCNSHILCCRQRQMYTREWANSDKKPVDVLSSLD